MYCWLCFLWEGNIMKGTSGITKDEYYMTIAKMAGMRSEGTPHTAACIVGNDGRIVSVGSDLADALDMAGPDSWMYISDFPGLDIAAKILHSNIHTVVYDEDTLTDSLLSLKIINKLISAGITCRKYQRSGRRLAFSL